MHKEQYVGIHKSLIILNPNTINSTPASKIITLASKFSHIITTAELRQLDDERRELKFIDPNYLPETTRREDVVKFWGHVSNITWRE